MGFLETYFKLAKHCRGICYAFAGLAKSVFGPLVRVVKVAKKVLFFWRW